MGTWLSILVIIVIGALIGGLTNSLAIKMLFRPYRAIYIAGWRLPFTPGLIPKRHDQLAQQLGRMVMDHLLTPEGIRKKLGDAQFQNEMVQWATQQAREFFNRDESLAAIFQRQFNVEDLKDKTDQKIEAVLQSMFADWQDRTLEDLLPEPKQQAIVEQIPLLSAEIVDQTVQYLQTPEGKARTKSLLEQSLSGGGMFANMANMFLGNDGMTEKLQHKLVKLLRQPMFRNMITQLLENEWEKVKQKPIRTWMASVAPDTASAEAEMASFIRRQLPTEDWLQTPLSAWQKWDQEKWINTWVPFLIDRAGQMVSAKMGDMFRYLQLEEIITSQVQSFAVGRVERLVLSISGREFRMITYLGAFLGGVIGLIQGLLLQMIG